MKIALFYLLRGYITFESVENLCRINLILYGAYDEDYGIFFYDFKESIQLENTIK